MAKKTPPLSISVPFMIPSTGRFNQTYDSLQTAKTNLYILLNTKPGERYLQPDFGFSIDNILFEITDEKEMEYAIKTEMTRVVGYWMPYIQLVSIKIVDFVENTDNNAVVCDISFSLVNDPGKIESFQNTFELSS